MANRSAPSLALREGDREELVQLTHSSSVRAGLAQRFRIVLLAAEGLSHTAIAERVGASRPTVIAWRDRYRARGLAGLSDEPRSGRPRSIDHAGIVTATLSPPPKTYGVTHSSTRLLARHLRIGDATVARAWRDYGVQPWRSRSFRFSTDPQLEAKVVDVVGLYLNPPENAVILSVTLFAALEIATGRVTAACKPRHRHQEFLSFLKQVARAYPGQNLHLGIGDATVAKAWRNYGGAAVAEQVVPVLHGR